MTAAESERSRGVLFGALEGASGQGPLLATWRQRPDADLLAHLGEKALLLAPEPCFVAVVGAALDRELGNRF